MLDEAGFAHVTGGLVVPRDVAVVEVQDALQPEQVPRLHPRRVDPAQPPAVVQAVEAQVLRLEAADGHVEAQPRHLDVQVQGRQRAVEGAVLVGQVVG